MVANPRLHEKVFQCSLFRLKPGCESKFTDGIDAFKKNLDEKIAGSIFLGGVFGSMDLLALGMDDFLFPHMSIRFNLDSEVERYMLAQSNFSCYMYNHNIGRDGQKDEKYVVAESIKELLSEKPYAIALFKLDPSFYKTNRGFSIESELFSKLKTFESRDPDSNTWVFGTYGWHEILMIQSNKSFINCFNEILKVRAFRFDSKSGDIFEFDEAEFKDTKAVFIDSITIPGVKKLFATRDDIEKDTNVLGNPNILKNEGQWIDRIDVKVQVKPGYIPDAQSLIKSELNSIKKFTNSNISLIPGKRDIVFDYILKPNETLTKFALLLNVLRNKPFILNTESSIRLLEGPKEKAHINTDDDLPQNGDIEPLDKTILLDYAKRKKAKSEPDSSVGKIVKGDVYIESLPIVDTLPLFRLSHLVQNINSYSSDPLLTECVSNMRVMLSHLLHLVKCGYKQDPLQFGRYLTDVTAFIEDVLLEEWVGSYYTVPESGIMGFADLSVGGTRRVRQAASSIPLNLISNAFKTLLKNKENEKFILESFSDWFMKVGSISESTLDSEKLDSEIKKTPFLFRARHRYIFEYVYPYGFNIPYLSLFAPWQLFRIFHETGHLLWNTYFSHYVENVLIKNGNYLLNDVPSGSLSNEYSCYLSEEIFCDFFEYFIGYERDYDLYIKAMAYRFYYLMAREDHRHDLLRELIPRVAMIWWCQQNVQGSANFDNNTVLEEFLNPLVNKVIYHAERKLDSINLNVAEQSSFVLKANMEFLKKELKKDVSTSSDLSIPDSYLRFLRNFISDHHQQLEILMKLFHNNNNQDKVIVPDYCAFANSLSEGNYSLNIEPIILIRALLNDYDKYLSNRDKNSEVVADKKNFIKGVTSHLSLIDWSLKHLDAKYSFKE